MKRILATGESDTDGAFLPLIYALLMEEQAFVKTGVLKFVVVVNVRNIY